MANIQGGSSTVNVANVDAGFNLNVALPTTPAYMGGVRMFSEIDPGTVTGSPYLLSPETDDDYRQRAALDTMLETDTFNYTAQNTGRYSYRNTTMAGAWSAAGFSTNSTAITTATTGVLFQSYATHSINGAQSLYCETQASLTNSPTINTIIDFGLFIANTSNPYNPTDGAYFRVNSSGWIGVINYNGAETSVSLSGFSATISRKYKFTVAITEREVEFWIDDVLYGTIDCPVGQGQPYMATSLPFSIRHAIAGGAAGVGLSLVVNDFTVSIGGFCCADPLGATGNRAYGSYQGLSGGTMGSLASYANNTTPAGAAASNTTALVTGLGGQATMNAQVGAAVDNIIVSYQVPAATANVHGRRLRVQGVCISAVNLGAAVATTNTTLAFVLNFGHTAVSLATTEGATAKAPRRIPLGIINWDVGAAIGKPGDKNIVVNFTNPVYVNAGEFIAVSAKFLVGTATGSQTIYCLVSYDCGWE